MKRYFPHLRALFVSTAFVLSLNACSTQDENERSNQHLEQSRSYLSQGQYRAALIEARNAIQLNNTNVEASQLMASMLLETGGTEDAIKLLEELREKHPDSFTYVLHSELMRAYQARGKLNTSLTELEASESLYRSATQNPLRLVLMANAHARLAHPEQAEALYKSALEQIETAASANSTDVRFEANKGLAELAGARGVETEMTNYLAEMRAAASSPEHRVQTQLFETKIALANEDYAQAETLLTKALSESPNTDMLTPTKGSIINTLSSVLASQGRTDEAFAYRKMLSDAFPEAALVQQDYNDALEKFKEGEYDQATTRLKNIIDEYPNYRQAKQLYGIILFLQNDSKASESLLRENFDPETSAAVVNRAVAANNLKLNDPQGLVDAFVDIIDNSKDTYLLGLYAIAQSQLGDQNAAAQYADRAIAIQPDNPRLALLSAQFALDLGSEGKERATSTLLNAIKANPDSLALHAALVRIRLAQEMDDTALAIASDYEKRFPNSAQAKLLTGSVYTAMGNSKQAESRFRQALDMDQTNFVARKLLAANYREQGSIAKSVRILMADPNLDQRDALYFSTLMKSANSANLTSEALAKIEKIDSLDALTVRGQQAIFSDDLSKAKMIATKISAKLADDHLGSDKRAPSAVDVQVQTIRLVREQDGLPAASEMIDQLIAGASTKDKALLPLLREAIAYKTLTKDAAAARTYLERIAALDRETYLVLSADIARADKDLDTAIASYKRAWEDYRNDYAASQWLTLNRQSTTPLDDESFNRFLEQWVDAAPDSISARLQRSTFHLNKGRYDSAARDLRHVLKQNRDNTMALNNLAWLLTNTGSPDEALPLAKRAYELAPASAGIADTYGWTLVQSGDVRQGLNILNKALALSPDNSAIARHVSEAKAKL